MTILYTLLFFALGATLTSFYGLVAQRLPKKETINGRSICPKCENQLKWIDIIPIIGYLVNRGNCRFCKGPIPLIHLLTELLGGILFAGSFLIFGINLEIIVSLVMISVLLTESISDLYYRIVIDRIWMIGIIPLIVIRIIEGEIVEYLIHSIALFFMLFIIAVVGKRAFRKDVLGGGDVKIFLFIGFCLTFGQGIIALFMASLFGLIYGLIKKNNEIPLIPFISVGVLLSFIYGEALVTWYLSLFGM